MTAQQAKARISEICNAFTFEYHGKICGVDPFSKTDFDMWCGEDTTKATSIDMVMNEPLFDGKCLRNIVEDVELIEW